MFQSEPIKKRELKAESKDVVTDEDDTTGERLYPVFKQSNSMNNMLPSVKTAHEEAAALSEKRKIELDPEEQKNLKRQKIEGIKKMLDDNKQSAQMEEMLTKFKVESKV